MKEKRNALPQERRAKAAKDCLQLLRNSSLYRKADWIYTYISFDSELDTIGLIRTVLNDGKHVAVPKIQGRNMNFWEILSLEDCRPGIWGILEPVLSGMEETVKYPAEIPGLILVPGLAFDRNGNRLGYGGGYYDRYLENHPGFISTALAYPIQIVDKVPSEGHDRRVDYILTPEEIIKTRKL